MAYKTSSNASTREQNRLNLWLSVVVVGFLIVVIMVACFGLFQKLRSNNERIAELNREIELEKQRKLEIEEFREYTETREYIEEIAREKLGLVYEGEIIFKEESVDQ
ncbi:MAG TPA: cell-division initiation protein [Lachnospiraceae bacterium]|jgi:cell division protein FtsB|nr:cell-division initiation protein [Lachnospiraceae bacterium]